MSIIVSDHFNFVFLKIEFYHKSWKTVFFIKKECCGYRLINQEHFLIWIIFLDLCDLQIIFRLRDFLPSMLMIGRQLKYDPCEANTAQLTQK